MPGDATGFLQSLSTSGPIGFPHFVFPIFLFSQLCTFRMTPWLILDRWWIGTKRAAALCTAASLCSRRLSGASPVTSPIHSSPPASPHGAVQAAAMVTGAVSQHKFSADQWDRAQRDQSRVRHLGPPLLRGPHTCIDLHFLSYILLGILTPGTGLVYKQWRVFQDIRRIAGGRLYPDLFSLNQGLRSFNLIQQLNRLQNQVRRCFHL